MPQAGNANAEIQAALPHRLTSSSLKAIGHRHDNMHVPMQTRYLTEAHVIARLISHILHYVQTSLLVSSCSMHSSVLLQLLRSPFLQSHHGLPRHLRCRHVAHHSNPAAGLTTSSPFLDGN